MRSRLAPIAALGGLCVAAALVAGSGCDKPEAFHMTSNIPTVGIQYGQGGRAGGGGMALGAATGGRTGSGGLFGGTGGVPATGAGGRGNGGGLASGLGGGAGRLGSGVGGAAAGGSSAGGTSAGGASVGGSPGAGGTAAGGAGGTMASGGAGGAISGGGGAGGGAPSLTIECRNDMPGDSTAMHAEIWVVNGSSQPIPLAQLRLRYYYVNEGGTIGLEIFDKAFKNPDGSGYRNVTAMFTATDGKLAAPPMDYTDIALMTAATLDNTVPFYFKMSLHDQNHSKLDLTNDYSNGPVAVSPCPHITAYLGDTLVAGVPPSP